MSASPPRADVPGRGNNVSLRCARSSLKRRHQSACGLSALARLRRDPLRSESQTRSSDLANEPTPENYLLACSLRASMVSCRVIVESFP